MSAEAIIDTEEDLDNAYQTLTWIGNQISFWTEKHVFIRMQYDDEDITFLNSNRNKMKYDQLIKDISLEKQRIYLEWVQETGQYLYYDLLQIAKKVKNVTFSLSLLKYDANNAECIKPSFDESADPEKILTSHDIILLSPQRSFKQKYTAMGEYYGKNILYLGPLPTKEFIKQCYVNSLFNCCSYSNDADVLQLPKVKEYVFDVAGWTVGRIEGDSSDEDEDNDNNDDGDNKKNDEQAINVKAEEEEKSDKIVHSLKDLQLMYLDKKIDLVDKLLKKGNLLIHCLAGAHRSPFITGCYEYKYGKLNGKTPKEIYKWLTSTRDIVQPLGYDRWMMDYFAFLENKKKSNENENEEQNEKNIQ